MENTSHLGLKKPDSFDHYAVQDFNSNAEVIDEAVKNVSAMGAEVVSHGTSRYLQSTQNNMVGFYDETAYIGTTEFVIENIPTMSTRTELVRFAGLEYTELKVLEVGVATGTYFIWSENTEPFTVEVQYSIMTADGTGERLIGNVTKEISNTVPNVSNAITLELPIEHQIAIGEQLVHRIYVTTPIMNQKVSVAFGGVERPSRFIIPLTMGHNDLAGLQGGVAGAYYHLSKTQHDKNLLSDGDGSGLFNMFTEVATRENLASGERQNISFGKMKKWFADLKAVAWSGNASDLVEDASNRLVTDSEKSTWNGKLNQVNDFTAASTSYPKPQILRDVYSYTNDASIVTGTMKIVLPHSWTNTMLNVEIDGYQHGLGSFKYILGGYNYAPSTAWSSASASALGSAPSTSVRFGHDGTKCCILIGNTTTTWQYPKIAISRVSTGYQNASNNNWDKNWSISFLTSESGVVVTSTPTCKVDVKTTDITNWNGKIDSTGGTITGEIKSSSGFNSGSWNSPTKGLLTQVGDNDGDQNSVIVGLKSTGARAYGIDFLDQDSAPQMRLYTGANYLSINSTTGSIDVAGNKVYHAGNDGTGSGLDADLLDGKDSTYFLSTAGKAADSNLLDGLDSSKFLQLETSQTVHLNLEMTHYWVPGLDILGSWMGSTGSSSNYGAEIYGSHFINLTTSGIATVNDNEIYHKGNVKNKNLNTTRSPATTQFVYFSQPLDYSDTINVSYWGDANMEITGTNGNTTHTGQSACTYIRCNNTIESANYTVPYFSAARESTFGVSTGILMSGYQNKLSWQSSYTSDNVGSDGNSSYVASTLTGGRLSGGDTYNTISSLNFNYYTATYSAPFNITLNSNNMSKTMSFSPFSLTYLQEMNGDVLGQTVYNNQFVSEAQKKEFEENGTSELFYSLIPTPRNDLKTGILDVNDDINIEDISNEKETYGEVIPMDNRSMNELIWKDIKKQQEQIEILEEEVAVHSDLINIVKVLQLEISELKVKLK